MVECIAWAPDNCHNVINESIGNAVSINLSLLSYMSDHTFCKGQFIEYIRGVFYSFLSIVNSIINPQSNAFA